MAALRGDSPAQCSEMYRVVERPSLFSQVVSSAALERMAGLNALSTWIDNVLLEWILILELLLDG